MDRTRWHFVSDGEGEDIFPANTEQVDVKVELDESEAKCRDESANILLETVVHNDKEAYEVYRAYAHHIGFSVHKQHGTFRPNSKNLKTKDFVCGRAGFKKELKATQIVKYKRADIKSGCPTMIRYAVDVEGNWTVKKFIESHNHSLANPGDKHLLQSSRKISELNAEVLKSMTQSGIRPRDAFNFLATEVEGVKKLECTKINAFNFIQRERRCRIENGMSMLYFNFSHRDVLRIACLSGTSKLMRVVG
ncbi:putative protein FAR1-RELATED SEQUENCE 10 [Phalaenopsis equestris]|uniref:putative protein FAR1-RELATED SEQUENCE 10 n=1 Tax=Phalaenopsis equestris TaxID=78828 RepID=UPI0009E2A14A|nr:putative protein FAR1-RELATED SEQUENCE 10 [Phalaenopsis equestris]